MYKDYSDILSLCTTNNTSLTFVKERIIQEVTRIFRADCAGFFFRDSRLLVDKEKTVLKNLSWKWADQYIKYYHRLDPFYKVASEVDAVRDLDIFPRTKWHKSEFFCDFIVPQRINQLLVMYVKHDNLIIAHLGILRKGRSTHFSAGDLLKARCLAKIINFNILQRILFEKSKKSETLLRQVGEISSQGIVILNSGLHPIFWNNRACEMIPTKNVSNAHNDRIALCPRLPDEVLEECVEIRRSIAEGNCKGNIGRKLGLYTISNRTANIEVEAFRVEQEDTRTQPEFYIIVSLKNGHVNKRINNTITLNDGWKLTTKEHEVVDCVCQGMTNKEISDRLYISLPTVATHLQHIFQKLDIKNRSSLICKIRN